MIPMERAFVRIAEGQVHYRHAGPPADAAAGRNPLWMMHPSPASSASMAALGGLLAGGRRVIAPDTLGNGDSAPPAHPSPDIDYFADAFLRTLDALGLERVDLYGNHTGAYIAVEMALARPDRVGRIVLDGIGVFTPTERDEYLEHYAPAKQPDAIGSQLWWALHFVRDQAWFFPWFRRDAAHNMGFAAFPPDVLHSIVLDVLKGLTTYHLPYRAAFRHPTRERLPLVRVPALVMADSNDPMKAGIDLAAELIPGAEKVIQDADWSLEGLGRKADRIARFLG